MAKGVKFGSTSFNFGANKKPRKGKGGSGKKGGHRGGKGGGS